MTRKHYDVVVVGSGAGGGTLAAVLSEGSKTVLVLEKGRDAPAPFDVGRDHLRNQRLSHHGVNAGPDDIPGNPRVRETATGEARTVTVTDGTYSNNAAIVGGGTRVYGAQAWRFHPLDFRMASEYGVPPGSSLADWCIGYDELAPFYTLVENQLGVCGDRDAMNRAYLPVGDGETYPMPPIMPESVQSGLLKAGAASLGFPTFPVPLAINSVAYNGRLACVHCGECPGFACPVDAKNGTHNTFLPRARLTGRCDIVSGATVTGVTHKDGTATGVSFLGADGNPYTVSASVVVVAAGAVETARLLLLSGVANDHIGRHVQGHIYPGRWGRFAQDMRDNGFGPGPAVATAQYCHHNENGIVGGAMLADDFVVLPVAFWKGHLPPNASRWGVAAKDWMQTNYRRTMLITGPVQEIPTPNMRVTLDPDVRDRHGLPVARLAGVIHPETVRTANYIQGKADEWLRASGAVETWGYPVGAGFSGGQHQAGTCRMSDDPVSGVVDRDCRVHGFRNLYVGDGSVHVTNGGFNPFLTIQALAYRTAKHLLAKW